MDIYTFLSKVVVSDNISDYAFLELTEAAKALPKEDCLSDNDYNKVLIIGRIVSISQSYVKGIVSYNIGLISNDNDNISDEIWNTIDGLDIEKLPVCIKARIYDLLWEYKKDVTAVVKAIKLYLQIFQSIFDEQEWCDCIYVIARATNIAARYNKKGAEYQKCIFAITEGIKKTNGKDTLFLSVRLFQLLKYQKEKISDPILIQYAENMITTAFSDDNVLKQEEVVDVLCWIHNGNQERITTYKDKLANQYLSYSRNANDVCIRRVLYLKKAIHVFRETKKQNTDALCIELGKLEKEAYGQMQKFTIKTDVSDHHKTIMDLIDKIDNFSDHLDLIAECTCIIPKSELFDELKEHSCFGETVFPQVSLDNKGHSIIKLPSIDFEKADYNSREAHLHMWNKAREVQTLCGDTVLTWLFDELNKKFSYELKDLKCLTFNNPIIPEGREDVILQGLLLGLKGNYYAAMHLLVPQFENILRYIAELCGDVIYTLKDDNTSEAKLLAPVFELPNLVDSLDEDLLFCLKGLLNEKAGSNLRNELAHGILEPQIANGGIGKYFLGIVIKMLKWHFNIIDDDNCN